MGTCLSGIYIPAITPFDETEAFSKAMLEKNIRIWNATGVAGYMCLGSNGEFQMLDDEESIEVIRVFCHSRGADKELIAGVGRESLYQTLRFIDRLWEEQLRIDYVSVLTPHYFRKMMDDTAIISYYKEIADRSPYPVLLYCAPGYANGVCISEQAVHILADHPNICGIKDTSPDQMDAYMDVAGDRDDFAIMAGSVNTLHKCLSRGGNGGVLSAANYFPDACAKLFEIWNTEGEAAYLEYEEQLLTKIHQTGGRQGVASVKCCMNLLGYQAGRPRRPLQALDENEIEIIKQNLFE